MANAQTVAKCKTKLDENDESPVTSQVTIVFDDEAATQKFAVRGAIIAWQSIQRAAGVIAESDTVQISELAKRTGAGFNATPESLANRVKKMPEAEYRQTLVNLGVDAKSVERMVKAHAAALIPAADKTKK